MNILIPGYLTPDLFPHRISELLSARLGQEINQTNNGDSYGF
jgi:hypothetical protein